MRVWLVLVDVQYSQYMLLLFVLHIVLQIPSKTCLVHGIQKYFFQFVAIVCADKLPNLMVECMVSQMKLCCASKCTPFLGKENSMAGHIFYLAVILTRHVKVF